MRRVHASSSSTQPCIVIIGANGQLGTDLMKVLADLEPVGLTHDDVDVTVSGSVREALDRHRPQIVVNTTAFNQVDLCESDPEKGFLVNAIGTHHVAETCRDLGAVLVHFSTDYVFDGAQSTPYSERDQPLPINAYGVSKLAGEQVVRYLLERYFIIRTSGLYGKTGSGGKGGNFVEWMLKAGREGRPVRVVNDQTLAPTYTLDLAEKVKEVILRGEYGLYHITNQGSCSWYEFAQRIFQISGIAADVTPITTRQYGAKARRPARSVLENGKLRDLGLGALRTWDEALIAYLQA
ncbi:MAG: dTDP-4-dehydrorhamnose reductase [Dehalococcoidia bacterium]|nr:dTDP-4-dehydrorhamnose reductase [Dehalococcoidia bacterium]